MNAVQRVLNPHMPDALAPGLCALAVMTKAPRAGKVKTRLTPPLTPGEAAGLNISFLRDTVAAITAAVSEGDARGVAVYTPVGAEEAYDGILAEDFELLPQRGDAFGERLICATEDLLQIGFDSVCLINSDSPTVPPESFSRAAKLLAQPDDAVVLGPSDDGGYYLIGLKKLHRAVFEKIDWSTERVLEQTIVRACGIGLKVELLPRCYDVDDRATLHRLCDELLGGDTFAAPETRKFLSAIIAREGRARIWP